MVITTLSAVSLCKAQVIAIGRQMAQPGHGSVHRRDV